MKEHPRLENMSQGGKCRTVQTLWESGNNAAGGRHGSKMSKIVVLRPFSAVLASQGDNEHRESLFSNSTQEFFGLNPLEISRNRRFKCRKCAQTLARASYGEKTYHPNRPKGKDRSTKSWKTYSTSWCSVLSSSLPPLSRLLEGVRTVRLEPLIRYSYCLFSHSHGEI